MADRISPTSISLSWTFKNDHNPNDVLDFSDSIVAFQIEKKVQNSTLDWSTAGSLILLRDDEFVKLPHDPLGHYKHTVKSLVPDVAYK